MKFHITFTPEKRKDKGGNLITENVPLFAYLKYAGQRIYYFTGYRVNMDVFDFNKQRVVKKESGFKGKNIIPAAEINSCLVKIENEMIDLFSRNKNPQKSDIVNALDNVLGKRGKAGGTVEGTGFVDWFEKYITQGKQSEIRKRNIKSILNHWIDFEKAQKHKIDLYDVGYSILQKFDQFLSQELFNERGEVAREKLSRNTVTKAMIITRAFFNYVRNEVPDVPYPFGKDKGLYRIQKEIYGTPIYINIEERRILESTELTNERLSKVRDVFLFQSFVGCRYGDLQKFTKANIVDQKLSYIAGKTKDGSPKTIVVPLAEKAITILQKYEGLPNGMILPPYSEQVLNRYLKELFAICGLTRNVSRLNPKTREPEQVRICDIASTHMARRTFVGALFSKNYDRAVIGSMSGHAPNSRALERYYSVTGEHKARAIQDIE
jgi:integrase